MVYLTLSYAEALSLRNAIYDSRDCPDIANILSYLNEVLDDDAGQSADD